jgi:hypothetical protein
VTVPALSDYEYQLEDDGIRLNPDAAGYAALLPFVDVDRVSGLDSPEYRLSQRDHEGVDGGYVDAEFVQARTIVIEGTLYADPLDADAVCDSLRYNYRPVKDVLPFYYKHPNKPIRLVYGKPQGVRYDVDNLRREGKTAIQMTILCPDPYIYDAVLQQGFFGRIVYQGSGHGFNHGFNLSFGGDIGDPGGLEVFNGGNRNAYPVITVFGPVTNPVISESSSGRHIGLDLTLGVGEYVEIDTRRHRVTLNGMVSRRNKVTIGSRWPYVKPGASAFTFSGSSNIPVPSATQVVTPPTFRNSAATLNSTAGTSVVITKPTGTVNDDVMVAIIVKDNQAAITAPGGWTQVTGSPVNHTGGNLQLAVYTKKAASEGANYTFTWTGAVRNSGWIGSYITVDGTTPVDVFLSDNAGTGAGPFSTPTAGTTVDGDWLITAIAERHATTGAATTWTTDDETGAGDAERLDQGTNGAGTDISHAVYDSNQPLLIGGYNRQLTPSQTLSQVCSVSLALKPASVSITNAYLVATDGDAADMPVGSTCYLVKTSGALREPTLFTISSSNSAFGFTNLFITPAAQNIIVGGDKLVANIPYFGVDLRSTWY